MSDYALDKPPHGWTCFHCGETFTTVSAARDHFGLDESADPGCILKVSGGAEAGLLTKLREAERAAADAWFMLHNECSDIAKALHSQTARHSQQLLNAEELGYERGLRDGRSERDKEDQP